MSARTPRDSPETLLRRGLEPEPAAVERVVAQALAGRQRPGRGAWLAAAAALLLGLALWLAAQTPPPRPRTTLRSGPGGIVILRTAECSTTFYSNARPATAARILIRQGGPP